MGSEMCIRDSFAYEGCDNTENIRKSVLGDIYHSQIVEVGAPKANTNFTRNNQEAYWRSIKNYGTWAKSKKNRGSVMYVGANDGALHAFATENNKTIFGLTTMFVDRALLTRVYSKSRKDI